jgi:hypothetical protein
MPIRARLPRLNLQPVDELIAVRKQQHGGGRGAPPIIGRERQGAVINKSCVLMLSALLQGYVEDVFVYASKRLFKTLKGDEVIARYTDTYFRWGNPNNGNIRRLFQRIGIHDVFEGLGWPKCNSTMINKKLQLINEARNKIAHGQPLPETMSLAKVQNLRNFADQFGQRFAAHVQSKLPA